MAKKHSVFVMLGAELPKNTGKDSGIVIVVKGPQGKLGSIELGSGSFRWYDKGAHKGSERQSVPTCEFSWTQFAEFMNTKVKTRLK